MKWAAPAYSFRSWNKWENPESKGRLCGWQVIWFVFCLVWGFWNFCLSLILRGADQGLGGVWKCVEVFLIVTIVEKNYWHLIERRSKEAKGPLMVRTVLSKNSCHTPKAHKETLIKFQLLEYFIYSLCKFKGGKTFRNLAYILKSDYL